MSRSIVMVDWTRNNSPTAHNVDDFLWQQMLLSLLYDEVLAPDETLLCSHQLAHWFAGDEIDLLRELMDCGGLKMLARPQHRYPDELRELAALRPIAARGAHLAKFSVTNDGEPIRFTDRQLEFHQQLDGVFGTRKRAYREAGANRMLRRDIMSEFSNMLATVLTDPRYQNWLDARFPGLNERTRNKFARLVEDPERAVDRIRRRRPESFRSTPSAVGGRFNTALAVQLAATFKPANDFQSLIETTFARCFCNDEGAEGRYGSTLDDLPLVDMQCDPDADIQVVDIRYTNVKLPRVRRGFGDIINAVKASPSGKQLRHAMKSIGSEATFESVRFAWLCVADELSRHLVKDESKEIQLKTQLIKFGKAFLAGSAAELLLNPPHQLAAATVPAGLVAAATTIELSGEYCLELIKYAKGRQRETDCAAKLRNAIDFGCIPHARVRDGERGDIGDDENQLTSEKLSAYSP